MLYSLRAAVLFGLVVSAGCVDPAPEVEPAQVESSELALCGDGVCEAIENPFDCPVDCSTPEEPACGDGFCRDNETWQTCPHDCDRP